MNLTRVKCLLVVLLLVLIGFGPISLTCLIGFYVVIRRPHWFYELAYRLYHDDPVLSISCPVSDTQHHRAGHAVRLRCLISLAILLVLDIAPVPVTGSIALYVVLLRPSWFMDLVDDIYRHNGG